MYPFVRLKLQIFVYYLLVQYANLVVRLVVNQLTKSMFHISITIYIGFHGIDDTIVCHTAFYNVKTIPWLLPCPAVNNEVKPFLVVSIK